MSNRLNPDSRHILASSINTRENVKLEKRLWESEERYRILFEQAAIGVAHVGTDGRWQQVNQKVCSITNYSAEELYARTFQDIVYPDDLPAVLENRQRLVSGEIETFALEVRCLHKDDSPFWLNIRVSPVRDEEGVPLYFITFLEEITTRRTLEMRTHRALQGLLKIAEVLVQVPEESADLYPLGQQLVKLTCDVLNCKRVGLYNIEPETEILLPVAVVGLSSEEEDRWWQEERQKQSPLSEIVPSEVHKRLRANEALMFDMSRPPLDKYPNPYGIKTMLAVPLCVGERLMGLLTLDHDKEAHIYTQDEMLLSNAIAKLSALVLERHRLLEERAEAQGRMVALREANERMEDFLSIASHELRTPLTTIKANVQLALRRLHSVLQPPSDRAEEPEASVVAAQGMLKRAERQMGVLNRLVNDMLDISRIHSDRLHLQIRQEPCNLIEIVQEVIEEQRKTTPNRTIELVLPAELPVPVFADRDRVAQVVANYLTNALKYSVSNQPVELTIIIEEQYARVSVRDYGQGLSAEDQQRVWECFYQSPNIKVMSGSGVGLGLGLYLSKTLIERHSGQVGVHSTPGEGSIFWFMLPLAYETASSAKEE